MLPDPSSLTPTEVALRSFRVALGPRTLMSTAPDHKVLVTTWRQDFWSGNAVHVETDVEPDDLDRWQAVFEERLGHLPGIKHQMIVWATEQREDIGDYQRRMTAACEERGLTLDRLTIMELDDLKPMSPATPVEVVPAKEDGDFAGLVALLAQGNGQVDFWKWRADRFKEMALAGRGRVWVVRRFGIPAAVAVCFRDEAGVASVDDVVVHPPHRRLGIGSHITAVTAGAHRDSFPDDRIVLGTDHGSDAERMYARLGFKPIATVWQATKGTFGEAEAPAAGE